MVNVPNANYQPAIAYQGGVVNTPQQEPKSGQTQPRQAPVADTQHSEQRSLSAQDDKNRGKEVDVKA